MAEPSHGLRPVCILFVLGLHVRVLAAMLLTLSNPLMFEVGEACACIACLCRGMLSLGAVSRLILSTGVCRHCFGHKL